MEVGCRNDKEINGARRPTPCDNMVALIGWGRTKISIMMHFSASIFLINLDNRRSLQLYRVRKAEIWEMECVYCTQLSMEKKKVRGKGQKVAQTRKNFMGKNEKVARTDRCHTICVTYWMQKKDK